MKNRTTGTLTVIAIAAVLAGFLVVFRAAPAEATYPVTRAARAFSDHVWARIAGCFTGAEARAENRRLRRELAALKLDAAAVERLESENSRLRRLLGYAERLPDAWIAGGVLAHGGAAAGNRHLLRVDRGALAGVRVGAAVVSAEGVVGRVTAVTPHTAEVMTLPNGSVKVSCRIETGRTPAPLGVIEGGSESLLVLRRLRTAKLPAHARVLTSGLGGVFPKDLVIGTLVDVQKDINGLQGDGLVLPAVDFTAVEDVFIRREE